MRTLRSFIAAVLIFVFLAGGLGFLCGKVSLECEDRDFSLWYSPYKTRSFHLLANNIRPETMLLMGSSEFRYGQNTVYHPKNLFRGREIDLLSVGGAYNQSLFHMIALGALEPELKNRKAVLLISPSWFKKSGVKGEDYGLRFSEMEYIAFQENNRIPKEIREYAARRSETLLGSNKKLKGRVRRIDRALLENKSSGLEDLWYQVEKTRASKQDRSTAMVSLLSFKVKKRERSPLTNPMEEICWESLLRKAENESRKLSNNPFDMSDAAWKKEIRSASRSMKGIRKAEQYDDSPEFRDLEYFLKLCQSLDIRCKLIVLPVNGKWFDYTGMTGDKREVVGETVRQLSEQYGAECAVLSQYDYEKYITSDAVHPWNKGWVKINEEIYRYYME
ncbi:MAG: D-alanyl-lipoteichoic acid biosynthesis protein DltD [Firmicutes bacterium]|nr:D-alanyl-lipoteichoic acid biosynthesis protein DltD [Bacillota bacterium]